LIQYVYLGRVGYEEALALQREMVELRHQGLIENLLLLLEHPPVLTLGRNAHRSNILATDAMLAHKGVSIHEINRGGDVTYHGPGQLVGYPIFDLRSLLSASGGRLGPVDFVRMIEEALIRLCAGYRVLTERIAGRTGVWTQPRLGAQRKIGAIGVHVSRGITSHGFALNVTTDLRDFQWIVPCGIADAAVTSLELEIANPEALPSLERIADAAARHFGQVFGEQVLAVDSLDDLRQGAIPRQRVGELAETAPGVQQVGAPLRVPQEIQNLRDSSAKRDGSFRERAVDA
jgi:lipoyl(octanoyl) transferase